MLLSNLVQYFYATGEAVVSEVIVPAGAVDSRVRFRSIVRPTTFILNPIVNPVRVNASARVLLRSFWEAPTLGKPRVTADSVIRLPGMVAVPIMPPPRLRGGSTVRLSEFESLITLDRLFARAETHISVKPRLKSFVVAPLLGRGRIVIGQDLVKEADEELLDFLLFM